MTIHINTTHTITCENAPVEEVYREMQDKCPGVARAQTSTVRMLIEDKDRLTRERDDAINRANRLCEENKILSRDNGFAMRRIDELQDTVAARNRERDEWAKSSDFFENEFNTKHDELVHSCNETKQERALKEALVAKVAALTRQRNAALREIDIFSRERNELQRKLEESLAVKETLIAENNELVQNNRTLYSMVNVPGGSSPALPEGMRIAEHPEYGRVVVSPSRRYDDCYQVYCRSEKTEQNAYSRWVNPSELTFLDEEPAPAPLPKPEDCKEGELYLATRVLFGMDDEVVAVRSDPDSDCPWEVSDECGTVWYADSDVTLLARLTPDREVK